MNWNSVAIAAITIGITFFAVFLLAKPINAYQLGESYAQSMGVNIKVFRTTLILLSSILSATVTAYLLCGHRCSVPNKALSELLQATAGDSGLLPGGRSAVYAL